MKVIGGYFELADNDGSHTLPWNGVYLNTSRNALEYIIQSIQDVRRVYLPYYTCEAVVQPLLRSNISYDFYHINAHFEIGGDVHLNEGEYIIVNNYFGLKDRYIESLKEKYGNSLIVDNAQALFAPILSNVKAFFSCRKFVGVSDGGIAVGVDKNISSIYDIDDTENHYSHLFLRKKMGAEAGFVDYRNNEALLDNQPIKRMSNFTCDILTHINYEKIILKRRDNFRYLHEKLFRYNLLELPDIESFNCPMVYPFLFDNRNLRGNLIENKIFVARYWLNVMEWCGPEDLEYKFANDLLPLPIDQRYGKEDMDRIVEIINKYR